VTVRVARAQRSWRRRCGRSCPRRKPCCVQWAVRPPLRRNACRGQQDAHDEIVLCVVIINGLSAILFTIGYVLFGVAMIQDCDTAPLVRRPRHAQIHTELVTRRRRPLHSNIPRWPSGLLAHPCRQRCPQEPGDQLAVLRPARLIGVCIREPRYPWRPFQLAAKISDWCRPGDLDTAPAQVSRVSTGDGESPCLALRLGESAAAVRA
jgi:hypothetical protein